MKKESRMKLRALNVKAQKNKRLFENEYIDKGNFFILKIQHKTKNLSVNVKMDNNKLDEVKKYYWKISVGGTITTRFLGKNKSINKILFSEEKLKANHKDRDRYNFLKGNLIFATSVLYVKSRKYPQTQEAPPGVTFRIKKEGEQLWVARFERYGHKKRKSFKIVKYGYEEAKAKAIEQRKKWEVKYRG